MAYATPAEPVEVEVVSNDARVRIAWADGHESVYSWRYLRGFCPCAACQGHQVGEWSFVAIDTPLIAKVEEVGNYALNIVWDDGGRRHTTGIYSFDVLRELC